MRKFEFARPMADGKPVSEEKAFKEAKLPEYKTKGAAAADFFCAQEVTVPSMWKQNLGLFKIAEFIFDCVMNNKQAIQSLNYEERLNTLNSAMKPTLVHTGIKAQMNDDEVLEIYSRSSNFKKKGLILTNSVGVVDSDYYNCPDNDGEIMFSFINLGLSDTTIKVGEAIGQGMFKKVLRPDENLVIANVDRQGGFGSTDGK